MPDRFTLITEVSLILIRDGSVCLLRRSNTGYADGMHCFIAGHKEAGESMTEAVVREAAEEAGIVVDRSKVRCVHVMHRNDSDDRVAFFFTVDDWHGEPFNVETDKHDELAWFPINDPPPTMIPYMRTALDHVLAGTPYSEFAWNA